MIEAVLLSISVALLLIVSIDTYDSLRRIRALRGWKRVPRRLQFLDRLGWPVERREGRPVQNFFRLLIHTRRITFREYK